MGTPPIYTYMPCKIPFTVLTFVLVKLVEMSVTE